MPLYRHHWESVAAFEKHCRARLGFFVTSATFRRSHWSLGGRHSCRDRDKDNGSVPLILKPRL